MSCLILSASFCTLLYKTRETDRNYRPFTPTRSKKPNQTNKQVDLLPNDFTWTTYSFWRGENPALTPTSEKKMIAARGSSSSVVLLLIALMLSSAFSQELWSQTTRVKRDKGGHHHQVGWPLSIFHFSFLSRDPPFNPKTKEKVKLIENIFTWASETLRHQCDDCQLTNS